MTTYSKVKLSGSTDGRAVEVAATATPGTTIHTADATALDEIWLYLHNTSLLGVDVTIQWGGVASPDDTLMLTIAPREGLVLAVPGLLLTNSLVLKSFASVTNVVLAFGFVNRIS